MVSRTAQTGYAAVSLCVSVAVFFIAVDVAPDVRARMVGVAEWFMRGIAVIALFLIAEVLASGLDDHQEP